ncbi:MAG: glycosyltransferase family 2 protein [bacterium]
MQKLAVIIVSYNTRDILGDCLRNLTKVAPSATSIVVVDNASTDGSAEFVRQQEFKTVCVVETENNGLAAGYNLGMAQVKETDTFLFLGSDAFPKPGCLEGVLHFLESHPKVGIATAKLILRNGALDLDAHRGFPTPWTALKHFVGINNSYFMTEANLNVPHEIDLCISHFMMVKKAVFDTVGAWDEDFFVYGEDVDLCWRAKQAGYQIYYLPQYECLHYKGASVGTRKETADVTKASLVTRTRMKKETTQAMRLFYQKHMYKKYPAWLNKLVDLGITIMERLRKS